MTDDRSEGPETPQDGDVEPPATEPVQASEPAAEAMAAGTDPVPDPIGAEAVAADTGSEAASEGSPGGDAPQETAPSGAESEDAAIEAAVPQGTVPEGPSPEGAAADTVADGEAPPPERVGRRGKRSLSHGQVHIKASFNNTIISITDLQGNSIAWTSGGSVGFKGSRKSTPYAAQVAAEQAARKAGEVGIRKLDVVVRGSGSGRETAIRTLQTMGMEVTGVKDLTPTPHNGCRQKKRRRG